MKGRLSGESLQDDETARDRPRLRDGKRKPSELLGHKAADFVEQQFP
jgi:hypothetical protein